MLGRSPGWRWTPTWCSRNAAALLASAAAPHLRLVFTRSGVCGERARCWCSAWPHTCRLLPHMPFTSPISSLPARSRSDVPGSQRGCAGRAARRAAGGQSRRVVRVLTVSMTRAGNNATPRTRCWRPCSLSRLCCPSRRPTSRCCRRRMTSSRYRSHRDPSWFPQGQAC
jgi:hypothetical protein